MVSVLYNNGADMQVCTGTGATALHVAVEKGDAALLALLISMDCRDAPNRAGDTAAELARRMQRPDLAAVIEPPSP